MYCLLVPRAATTSDAFNAVAEPRRRDILDYLALQERPVGDIVLTLGLEQPAVSKHLRVLRNVGLVHVRRVGRHKLYRTNVRANYRMVQNLLPLLRKRPGQVVFINSSVGLSARPNVGQFSATQHALRALTDALRAEISPDGIRVLSVYPGRVATPRQEKLYTEQGSDYKPQLLVQAEDIASVVLNALLLPRSAEVTEISIRPLAKTY